MDGNQSKHKILKELKNILPLNDVTFIRPLQGVTGEWIVQLPELKNFFNRELQNLDYLKGTIALEPDYWVDEHIPHEWQDWDYETREAHKRITTSVKFHIDPDDIVPLYFSHADHDFPELAPYLKKFRIDHPDPSKVGFIMMKFDDTRLQNELIKTIKTEGNKLGISFIRADDKPYADELLPNIRTYMHGCGFGIAIFERLTSDIFNPNVSLEVGYMMAMKKPILFLKDGTLPKLHTDLVSKLYEEFDIQNPEKSIPKILTKWLKNAELID